MYGKHRTTSREAVPPMSTTQLPQLSPSQTQTTSTTPRAARGAAAVIAQYIQDLTHSVTQGPRAAAA
jgi:hypothetical protein